MTKTTALFLIGLALPLLAAGPIFAQSAASRMSTELLAISCAGETSDGWGVLLASDAKLYAYVKRRSYDRFYLIFPGTDASSLSNEMGGNCGFTGLRVEREKGNLELVFEVNPKFLVSVGRQEANLLKITIAKPLETTNVIKDNSISDNARKQPNSVPTQTENTAGTVSAVNQISPRSRERSLTGRQGRPEKSTTGASKKNESPRRRLILTLGLSSAFSSNIRLDDDPERSFGFAPSWGIHFQNRDSNPDFKISYGQTSHSFTSTNRYDRISQHLEAAFYRQPLRRLKSETGMKILLKGSSDSDSRSVGDQYTFSQAFEYRIARRHRLRAFGAYRIKKFADSPKRNAVNPFFGLRYEQRLRGARHWEIGYRYDDNRTEDRRRSYLRRTYSGEFGTPLFGGDRLKLGARYRPQLYARQITVGGERVPRSDHRWIFSAEWERPLRRDLDLNVGYYFETRNSNDRSQNFNEHFFGVSLTYRLGLW